jgi:hypothetical protein
MMPVVLFASTGAFGNSFQQSFDAIEFSTDFSGTSASFSLNDLTLQDIQVDRRDAEGTNLFASVCLADREADVLAIDSLFSSMTTFAKDRTKLMAHVREFYELWFAAKSAGKSLAFCSFGVSMPCHNCTAGRDYGLLFINEKLEATYAYDWMWDS